MQFCTVKPIQVPTVRDNLLVIYCPRIKLRKLEKTLATILQSPERTKSWIYIHIDRVKTNTTWKRLQIQREGRTSDIGEWDYHEENETRGKKLEANKFLKTIKKDSKEFQGIVQIIEC